MSHHVYPVTKTLDQCNDYEVLVNGVPAELNTARVSAYPFNRRWPGHQRQIEQTELINFLSMESDGEVELTIIPRVPSFAVRIRPRSLEAGVTTDADGVIRVRVTGAAQFTVEPYGRSRALHVFIDPPAAYRVDRADPQLLYFGAGEHDVGDLYLQSGQTLYLDEGAVLYATLYALHAENIRILGRGILDNSRHRETVLFEASVENNKAAVANAKRNHAVNFVCCKNVEVDGITIRDSLCYNLTALSSENVQINNLKIIGAWRFNSDGVHFANCQNCSLTNSFLRTFDDSICVRGFANYDYDHFLNDEQQEALSFVCKNILIKNCVVWNDWGKNLQVGTETYSNEITSIRFEDCKLIHTSGYALTIWLVDNARVHDVAFVRTLVEYDDPMHKMREQSNDAQIYIDDYDPSRTGTLVRFAVNWHFEYSLIKSAAELGSVRNVRIEDLQLYALQKPKFVFRGASDRSPCADVTLDGVYWNGEPIPKALFERQTEANEFVSGLQLIEK